ncbi:hypothetical protein [Bifidobacterium samirii]|uniref:Uncharacterized protein n=1 Tax=Bifidobacterium samirii TaxID=2306974 RepID=A0A430FJT5_9BIFI|nr:hypothetical protein [Bifidobacterium samirii]RSX53042.1 hypothetical protein D2E24_1713 [Bifidobacterium samirii]
MNMQRVSVRGLSILIPQMLDRLDRLPDDPPEMTAFAGQTGQAACVVFLQPIPPDRSMPFGDERAVVDGIHRTLAGDQGLIEVVGGTADSGRSVMWSIVKTVSQEDGVQYGLTLHLDCAGFVVQVQAFASEVGVTGIREAQVYEFARQHGWVDEHGHGWARDPYDDGYGRGVLMNLSEDDGFDDSFPEHPLSVVRAFVSAFVGCN